MRLNDKGVMESLNATIEGVTVLEWVLVREKVEADPDEGAFSLPFDPLVLFLIVFFSGLASLGAFGLYRVLSRDTHESSDGSLIKVKRRSKGKGLKRDPKREQDKESTWTVREVKYLDKEQLHLRFEEIMSTVTTAWAERIETEGISVSERAITRELKRKVRERFESLKTDEMRIVKAEFEAFMKEHLPVDLYTLEALADEGKE